MKDKTITVRVPDFCPEDCEAFRIEKRGKDYYCRQDGDCTWVVNNTLKVLCKGCDRYKTDQP